jgi:hypothetical protein
VPGAAGVVVVAGVVAAGAVDVEFVAVFAAMTVAAVATLIMIFTSFTSRVKVAFALSNASVNLPARKAACDGGSAPGKIGQSQILVPVGISPAQRIVLHVPVQVQRLWIVERRVRHSLGLRGPVRAHEPARPARIVPGAEIVVTGCIARYNGMRLMRATANNVECSRR